MANTVVDQQRPGKSLPGEAVNTAAERFGLALVAIAVVSLVVCVTCFATKQIDVGVGAASVSLLAAGASLAYRSGEGRRIRQVQRDWDRTHSVVR